MPANPIDEAVRAQAAEWFAEYDKHNHFPEMLALDAYAAGHAAAQQQKQARNPWQEAVDRERVSAHLGIAADGVSVEEAVQQVTELIDWHVQVATDPSVNGGFSLQPVQQQAQGGGQVLGYVRRAAIQTLRADDEVTGVMVHIDPPTDSVPVYLAPQSAPVGVEDAEIETLKAEVAAQRTRSDAMTGEAIKHEARAERLAEALRGLLNDTQHKDHNCGDAEWCPVIAARAALEQENGRE
jgi:hypothetical protein